jgi:LysM repeat protein
MRRRWIVLLSAAALVALAVAVSAQEDQSSDSARGRDPDPGVEYVVQSGDTLSEIAERYDVSVDVLVAQNEGLNPDRIREGQRIRIDNGTRRVEHLVREGESLARIAARYEVTIPELLRWNRGLRPDSRSESIGTPNEGRLAHARQLPTRHRAFSVRNPDRAFATDETARWMIEAFEAVRAEHPDAPRLEVRDISRREGGPLAGHHSHQSGRDADVAYYRESDGSIDVELMWTLFSHWLARGRVDAIFMDHGLQRVLYEHARSVGVPRADLSRWFQYPREIEQRYGVIRHHPRHANHFHARFVCPETDAECR